MGSIFGGLKMFFFRASCFGFRVKGVCPLLLSLVSLVSRHFLCNSSTSPGGILTDEQRVGEFLKKYKVIWFFLSEFLEQTALVNDWPVAMAWSGVRFPHN